MTKNVSVAETMAGYNRLNRKCKSLFTPAAFHQMLVPKIDVNSIFTCLTATQDEDVINELTNEITRLIMDADILNAIGNQFFNKGHARIAIKFYEASFQRKPENPLPLKRKGNALRVIGEVEQAVQAYQRALAIKYESGLHSRMLLAMHYESIWTPEEIAAEHFTWHHDIECPAHQLTALHSDQLRTDQKDKVVLKIGYLSPDFRSHPVAYFCQPILFHHNRANFHITAYSTQSSDDAVTRRIKRTCDDWCDAEGMSTLDLAKKIISDKIDILVDLAGHTSGNRLDVFQLHPAPVQITYLGYPNGTGLRQMDYRITDEVSDPSGKSEHLYSEKLVRISPCFLTFEPSGSPEVAPAPCGTKGFITFGSFNKFAKLSDECIAAWVGILNQAPNTRLFLKTGGLENALEKSRALDRFRLAGLQDVTRRVEIHDLVPSRTDHLRLYDRIDIALDPFPYNGTTTTCQALWMGVPVISLKGDRHVARVGASILGQMGLEELVADSVSGYVEIATRLARQPDRIASLRQIIRPRLAASPLLDHRGFTQKLESLYQSLRSDKCRNIA